MVNNDEGVCEQTKSDCSTGSVKQTHKPTDRCEDTDDSQLSKTRSNGNPPRKSSAYVLSKFNFGSKGIHSSFSHFFQLDLREELSYERKE